jgi:hypothetical protein
VYRVTTDERSQPQIDALPPKALAPFAEAHAALETAPWGGASLNGDQRRIDVLDVLWLG